MTPIYIYGLFDPHTNHLRYVGQTKNPKQRFRGHLTPSALFINNYKNKWIKGVLATGSKPVFELLDCLPADQADEIEAFYLCYFRSLGWYPTYRSAVHEACRGERAFIKGYKFDYIG